MKSSVVLSIILCVLLISCSATMPTPNIEATVQAAIQQTMVAPPNLSIMLTPMATPEVTVHTAIQQTTVVPPAPSIRATPTPELEEKIGTLQKLLSLCWVTYSPTHFDPDKGVYPSETEIRKDLKVLYDSSFRGLVTYGATSTEQFIPKVAKEIGFEGVIMGIWSPTNAEEIENAKSAMIYADGYIVGNEGLFFGRYDFNTLKATMDNMRIATRKPVATTEVLNSYFSDARLGDLGDWISPTVHPYWNGARTAQPAVAWTQQQFVALKELYKGTGRVVVFKEVGLPTAGDSQISEAEQAEYYKLLRMTNVNFFYFEAFDQPWKTSQPVEPYWGLFNSDRSPKTVVNYICK
jgi:exo-beta-1,3-glucanase (GH17 family)